MATTRHAVLPSLTKAIQITQYGGSEQLKYEEIQLPEIGPGHVLVKVRYAGVNPVDWKTREGYVKQVRPELARSRAFRASTRRYEVQSGGRYGGHHGNRA